MVGGQDASGTEGPGVYPAISFALEHSTGNLSVQARFSHP